ncbi:MAG: hypothetical protein KGR22_04080 [Planctomycetes bacterium]|nr:hypothetical protein [Planctomycetota bacterium]
MNAELLASNRSLEDLKQRINTSAALDAAERAKAESDERVKPLLVDMARLRAERDAAPAGSEAAATAATALAAVERQHANLIDDIGRLNRESERRSLTQSIATLTDRRSALERSIRQARGEPEPAPAALATGSLRLVTLDGTTPPITPESPDSDAPTMVAPSQVDTVMSTSYVFDAKLDKWVPAKEAAAAPAQDSSSTTADSAPGTAQAAAPLMDEDLIPKGIREKYSVADIQRIAKRDIEDGTLDGRVTRLLEIDYRDLIAGRSILNVIVRPDDFINVVPPPTGVVYIDGEISRPGPYDLPATGQLTLSRLVAAAGGLGPLAIPERVDLVRRVGDREATIRVNLAAIRERAEPDIALKSDDHVIIGTNFFAQPLAVIRNGFRMTYGFGFLIDRNWGTDIFGPPPEALTVQ